MANDNRRSRRLKNDESVESKKKMVTQDASTASKSQPSDASSSRRSSKEISSKKQSKESPASTRKSERLENMKTSGTPIKEKSERIQEQVIITPMKRYDRRKKDTSLRSLGLENFVEDPASSNTKLKKENVGGSMMQNGMDTSENKSPEKKVVDVGGRKRKRVATCVDKALSKPQHLESEAGSDNDNESQDVSCQASSSSKKDVDKVRKRAGKSDQIDNNKKSSGSKSLEDKDDDGEECSDKTGNTSDSSLGNFDVKDINDHNELEQARVDCSKNRRRNHGLGKQQELTCCDTITDLCDIPSSKDRTTCEADDLTEFVETNNGVLRMGTSLCFACKLAGKLRYCDAVGCNRCYHLSCLDPPVNNVLLGNWRCAFCVKNNKSSVPSVSGVTESIWDTREVEVADAEGLRKQKQYFVKYKGLAHIHNQWVAETKLLCEAPSLVDALGLLPYIESLWLGGSMRWKEEWTVPQQLLNKRLLLSFKPLYKDQRNTGKVLNYHYEWLVKWQGLGDEQATWESETISALDSPEGHKLIKEYEKHHGNTKICPLPDAKIEDLPVSHPTIPNGPPGMDNIHLNYVKNLHDAWNKGQNSIIFDEQERAMRIVLFIISLKGVTLPFLLITTSDSISQWEAMFSKIAHCNNLKISLEEAEGQRSSRLLEFRKEGGQLAFQVLLFPVDTFVKDLNVLNAIKWETVMVDESQSSEISVHFSHIKSLSTKKRLFIICGQLSVNMAGYLDMLSLFDCDVSKTELNDISRLTETLSKFIAYESKSSSSKFVEFWVPVQISNVQLEQYCSMLLSNAMALSSCSKSDTCGALHDILVSNRKCCDHPYIVDQSLQGFMTKNLEPAKFLDVGIKASGKLQFLDLILPEMKKRQLRVLILFQTLSGSGKGSTSIGDILDDFVRQRFGADSYERIDGIGTIPSKKQVALSNFNNKEMGRFIFLLEYRACFSSIKLSSVDTIVIFDSDWNPANDLRALQKISIDSQSEQIMIFRLYTSWTLEEKILRLAEHNVTIDGKLQNLSRSTSDALLMWGATYLFNKLAEFHSASENNISSEEECFWSELIEEFLKLISHECMNKDPDKLRITKLQSLSGNYSKNLPSPSELVSQLPDGEPHTFWRNLLLGRNPSWKYLSTSTPRHRKRSQYFEESPIKANASNGDVRKRKKAANNIVESLASKPATEDGEVPEASGAARVLSHERSQSTPVESILDAAICDEASFRHLLKVNISKLCAVLRLSEDVKIMVENFLEYVIDNYRVNKEPANTLQAFLISLCWIGSALLKHKLDKSQSLALANEHLNFSCKEEEVNSVYLKLKQAKDMFLLHTENQKKTGVSKDLTPTAAQATSMRSLDPRGLHFGPLSPQGSANVDVNGEVSEDVQGIRNQEQSKRTCSSSNGIKPTSFHISAKQIVDVAESSESAEDIPAKKYEGAPTDVGKQVDSVGMKVVASDGNQKRVEADTTSRDGSHYDGEDQNDFSCNDVEGHAMGAVAVKCNVKHSECGTINRQASNAMGDKIDSGSSNGSTSASAAASKEKVPSVQLLVSSASDQSVSTNLEIRKELLQAKEVQGRSSLMAEISNLRITDDGKVGQVNPEDSSLQSHHEESCSLLPANSVAAENESQVCPVVSANTPLGEQNPHLHSADIVDCQPFGEPLNLSQYPEAPPQVLEMTTGVPNHNATPPWPNLSNFQGYNNHNQGALRMHRPSSNPLEAELEKLHDLKNSLIKYHEAMMLKLKSDHEKELAEMIALLNRKHEAKRQDADAVFQLRRKEVDINLNQVIMNKILAEAFRSKCQDLHRTEPSGIQVTRSGSMGYSNILPSSVGRSTSSSPAQSSGIQQPPLQIVHQSAQLFSTTPSKASSTSSMPTRPTSNLNPITTARPSSRPLPNIYPITPSTRLSRPPPNINSITPSSVPTRPSPYINPSREATRPHIIPSNRPSSNITPSSRPPPSINAITPSARHSNFPINRNTTPSARNLQALREIRAPAPHIRPFKPSTSVPHDRASPRVMPSQHTSTNLPWSSSTLPEAVDVARPPPLLSSQKLPPVPANHNGHPIQNSPRNSSGASTLLAQASSQPPASLPTVPTASAPTEPPATPLQLPSLSSSLESEQHPKGNLSFPSTSLPPLPSISISHSGLYSTAGRPESGIRLQSPDILSRPALHLLMDMDKQAGFHLPQNILQSPSLDVSETEKVDADDIVCLSDDD